MDIIRDDNPVRAEQKNDIYDEESFLNDVFIDKSQYARLKSLLLTKRMLYFKVPQALARHLLRKDWLIQSLAKLTNLM